MAFASNNNPSSLQTPSSWPPSIVNSNDQQQSFVLVSNSSNSNFPNPHSCLNVSAFQVENVVNNSFKERRPPSISVADSDHSHPPHPYPLYAVPFSFPVHPSTPSAASAHSPALVPLISSVDQPQFLSRVSQDPQKLLTMVAPPTTFQDSPPEFAHPHILPSVAASPANSSLQQQPQYVFNPQTGQLFPVTFLVSSSNASPPQVLHIPQLPHCPTPTDFIERQQFQQQVRHLELASQQQSQQQHSQQNFVTLLLSDGSTALAPASLFNSGPSSINLPVLSPVSPFAASGSPVPLVSAVPVSSASPLLATSPSGFSHVAMSSPGTPSSPPLFTHPPPPPHSWTSLRGARHSRSASHWFPATSPIERSQSAAIRPAHITASERHEAMVRAMNLLELARTQLIAEQQAALYASTSAALHSPLGFAAGNISFLGQPSSAAAGVEAATITSLPVVSSSSSVSPSLRVPAISSSPSASVTHSLHQPPL